MLALGAAGWGRGCYARGNCVLKPREIALPRLPIPVFAAALLFAQACQPNVPVVSTRQPVDAGAAASDDVAVSPADAAADVPSTGDSGGGQPDAGAFAWPQDKSPPTVIIAGPADGTAVKADKLPVTGHVSDDKAVAALSLRVGFNVPFPVKLAANGQFAVQVPMPVGTHTIVATAHDVGGNAGSAKVTVTRIPDKADSAAPQLEIIAPKPGFTVFGDTVAVSGTTKDDTAVVGVRVQVGAGKPVMAQTDDDFQHFWLDAPISETGAQSITVTARDTAGNVVSRTVKGASSKVFDTTAPKLAITTPAPGFSTAEDAVVVKGTATDGSGVAAVDVRVGKGPYQPAQNLAGQADAFATWSYTAKLQPGPNVIKARARDKTGLYATTTATVTNTTANKWSAPRTIELGYKTPTHAEIAFTVDRAGLGELFTPAKAAEIVMLKLDVRPLIEATFSQIRNACGSGWHKPGKSTAGCPKEWGQAEKNLWRLVTMTPGNVNVKGTSIESMKSIADGLAKYNLLDHFSKILAAALGIGVYDLIVGEKAVAESMVQNVIATHPEALSDGRVPVTLRDALTDLATMGQRFDANGKHPGFLDKTSPPHSIVMTKDFKITMTASSNLHWHDGVALDGAAPDNKAPTKSYVALVADTTGPTFDDVLEFDFVTPGKFAVSGLAAKPTSKMTFKVSEHASWAKIGSSMSPLPKGNSVAWKLDPWLLEHTLVDASYRQYKSLRRGCSYCGGKSSGALLYESLFGLDVSEIVVGRQGYRKGGSGSPENFKAISPNPAGWLRIWTLFGLGSPPAPQYVWDMILEVSQRRLLDGGVKQGKASTRFTLAAVPVGMTGEQIKKALAPEMQAQKSKLSTLLMGKQAPNEPLDFWLRRGDDKELRLYFAAPGDPLPAASTKHAKRGFYSDPQLSKKVSSKAPGGSGDSEHEKLGVGDAPKTVYAMSAGGQVHRVQIEKATDSKVTLVVRRWIGGGTP